MNARITTTCDEHFIWRDLYAIHLRSCKSYNFRTEATCCLPKSYLMIISTSCKEDRLCHSDVKNKKVYRFDSQILVATNSNEIKSNSLQSKYRLIDIRYDPVVQSPFKASKITLHVLSLKRRSIAICIYFNSTR